METKHKHEYVHWLTVDRCDEGVTTDDARDVMVVAVEDHMRVYLSHRMIAAPALLAALPDPDKLETLADWFDLEQRRRPDWVGKEVQTDLRNWATKARAAIAAATTAAKAATGEETDVEEIIREAMEY